MRRLSAAAAVLLAACNPGGDNAPTPDETPAAPVDHGISNAAEAVDLVERWEEEGFGSGLAGALGASGNVTLWDPAMCEGTAITHNNTIVLQAIEPLTVAEGGFATEPVNPVLRDVRIRYARVCEGEAGMGPREGGLVNAARDPEEHETLIGYVATMQQAGGLTRESKE